MPVIKKHHFRLISVLLFGFFLTGSSSAHYITHLHTEFETAMKTGCGDDDHSGHSFHFHTDPAPHADCNETHCRQVSCNAPGIAGNGSSLHEPAVALVEQFIGATTRDAVRFRLLPHSDSFSPRPHRLVTVLRI